MSEEWVETTLGEVLTRVRRRVSVENGVAYPSVGVAKEGKGLIQKAPFVGGVSKYDVLYKVHHGDVVLRTITAFESPAAIAGQQHDSTYVSQVFFTYEVSNLVLPELIGLFFQSPSFWWEMENRASGTVLRRKTISDLAFCGIPFTIPPLTTQRRIMAVIDSIDKQIAAIDAEREALELLRNSLLTEAMNSLDSVKTFGELSTIRSGPSWSAKNETKVPVPDSIRVVKITNTRPDGTIDMSDETYVKGLPPSTLILDEASLVLIRTNGNRQRIGNVYVPSGKAIGCAVSAFQFLVDVDDAADRDFIYLALKEPTMQNRMSEAASGTTGLGNIAAGWLKKAEIPWSENPAVRSDFALRFQSISAQINALITERESLKEFRSATLNALLSREIEIPESFDKLLAVKVAI